MLLMRLLDMDLYKLKLLMLDGQVYEIDCDETMLLVLREQVNEALLRHPLVGAFEIL